MELFGIAFSVPVAAIASTAYVATIKFIVNKFQRLTAPLVVTGIVILGMFVAENVLLILLGAVESRSLIGPTFYLFHLIVFVLGVPAIANVLVLGSRQRVNASIAVAICTAFALVLVLEQYAVSEALFGVDGEGPYDLHTQQPRSAQTLTP